MIFRKQTKKSCLSDLGCSILYKSDVLKDEPTNHVGK